MNIEDGSFRYFYAHEINTLLDGSKLVCTKDYLMKLKEFANKTDVIELCSRERKNTKWRFNKVKNLTVFDALLRDVLMGCKDAVLPKRLLTNGTINCSAFGESTIQPDKDNLCVFRTLTLHLHGFQRLEEEISNFFQLFINKMDRHSPNHFRGVHINDISIVQDLPTLNSMLYDIVIVDGIIIAGLLLDEVFRNAKKLCKY